MVDVSRSRELSVVLVAGFVLAMLLPILTTGYLGDDIFNSFINGVLGWHHLAFPNWLAHVNAGFIRRGRFAPVALLEANGLFHVVPSLGVYKVFQILITVLNVLTFVVLLRTLRLPRALSLLAVVVLLCSFQMRYYHDGILGFSGLIEFTTELVLLSLLGLVWFARTRNVWALAGSFVAYALGLCTYELTYLMCFAMLGILAVELPWRRALRLAAPYFILSFAVICLQVYVKAAAHMPADANYSVSPHASAFLVATAIQAVAAIPLTYLIINPAGVFASGAGAFAGAEPAVTLGIALLAFTCVWTLVAAIDPKEIDRRTVRSLAAIGCVVWITPAIMVAASVRYQRELVFGLGHIPVYLEYFGFSMLIVAAGAAAIERWGVSAAPVRVSVSLAVALLATLTYSANASVIAKFIPARDAAANVDAALVSGLLKDVPDGAELLIDDTIPLASSSAEKPSAPYSDRKYYFFLKAGKRLTIHYVGAAPGIATCAGQCRVGQDWYDLINVPLGPRAGYVALGRVLTVKRRYSELHAFASQVSIFFRGAPTAAPLAVGYMEHGCKHPDRLVSQPLPLESRGLATVRPAPDCTSIDMNTLALSESLH